MGDVWSRGNDNREAELHTEQGAGPPSFHNCRIARRSLENLIIFDFVRNFIVILVSKITSLGKLFKFRAYRIP